VSVASVGPSTTVALTHAGVAVALEGPGTGAAALGAALAADKAGLHGRRILWPRSDLADMGWTAGLEAEGAQVAAPVAYSTVDVPLSTLGPLPAAVEAGEVAALTFCSPSSARSVARAFHGSLASAAGHAAIAVLGRTTAGTIENLGGRVDVVARRPEAAVLADDLARFLCARGKGAS
jgi:uroporphyrinogen III methyltransferase/synthase